MSCATATEQLGGHCALGEPEISVPNSSVDLVEIFLYITIEEPVTKFVKTFPFPPLVLSPLPSRVFHLINWIFAIMSSIKSGGPGLRPFSFDPPNPLKVPIAEPKGPSKLSKFFSTIYDVILCAAALLLIAKVGVIFYAHNIDKHATGPSSNAISDAPSSYTIFLMRYNSQVCILSVSFQRYEMLNYL
jgi:hypothetical protein